MLEPVRAPQEAVERLCIMDGTVVPVRDPSVGRPPATTDSRRTHEVIVDADMRLLVAAVRPVPGTTADVKAWRDPSPAEQREGVTVLGDGAPASTPT